MRGCSMAASDKKLQSFNAFNAGEYSKDLAGRTDLESFGSSTRYCSNFLSQVSGGLKKFYGTRHITEQTLETGFSKIKLIPFINKYEPMAFVLYGSDDTGLGDNTAGIKIGLLYGDNYKDLNIELPNIIDVNELRWKQINDRVILCHNTIKPMTIDFYGLDDSGEYIFQLSNIVFTEEPFFPIGTTNDYFGMLEANGLEGTVTLSLPSNTSNIRVYFTPTLIAQSTYVRSQNVKATIGQLQHYEDCVQVDPSTVTLYRKRSGVSTALASGQVNVTTLKLRSTHEHNLKVTDTITQNSVLQVVRTICPDAYINNTQIVLPDLVGHQNDDIYYMTLSVGEVRYSQFANPPYSVLWQAFNEQSDDFKPEEITVDDLQIDKLQGRKIKFFFNDDTEISPWWQGKSVTTGDYAYSNGHWYQAMSTGTCGNVQPSHTFGTRSDGAVAWKYLHSGSTTAVVGDKIDSTSFTVYVKNGETLPNNTKNANNKYEMKNYAWSIWGKDGVYPSDVYMVGNRLGFVCNTESYGSWNSMSVTDDYFNFSTEEYGEQLDTSAIVHLVGNNEASDINWVLARSDVYMGGYSGEYHIASGTQNKRGGAYTPTSTFVQNISNIGGKAVVPLKYKQLNMFVGLTGKELYTVAYDYTIDDYTPKSLGYLTQHIMDKGIRRMEALNNLDRNIYLLHDTKELSLFNYAAEQKVMGFTELNFGDDVIDFVSTYAKDEVAAYVAIKRNDGKVTIERFSIANPNYMFDEITQGNGTLADFQPVSHFANRTVYIKYGDDFSQFIKVELDENGDVPHDLESGFYMPQAEYFKVGLPMVSEMHTQPAFGNKVEGHQQQSLSLYIRLVNSGAFEYGSSVDFTKYFRHEYWNLQQEYGSGHRVFTGDLKLEIPLGYAEAQNQGEGPYPNTSAVGINIKSDTPEPLNILSIQEIYR